MAGPYTGSWRSSIVSQAEYTGALRWGTGVNPVHAIPGSGEHRGKAVQVIDPITTGGGEDSFSYVAEDQQWDTSSVNPDPNLPQYDITDPSLYGANEETGTDARPVWGSELGDRSTNEMGWGLPNPDPGPPTPNSARANSQNSTGDAFPTWGNHAPSKGDNYPRHPGGMFIRALTRGNEIQSAMRVLPNEDVAQGWTNKNHGKIADSRPADDSQVFMQTSEVQRYKTREGSQRSASQSTFAAPVESRVTGQKLKTWTSEQSARHWDMLPYEQQDYARPFLSRQAGTGYPQWQLVNEMYVSPAIQREPASDPQLGPVAGDVGNTASDFGYSYEDMIY